MFNNNPTLSGNPTSFAPPVSILGQTNSAINAGNPAMDQVSAQAPTFNPNLQAPPNQPMPDKSPMSQFAQGLAQPQNLQGQLKPQKPPQSPLEMRRDLIVKALTSHLAALDKLFGGQNTQPSQPTQKV